MEKLKIKLGNNTLSTFKFRNEIELTPCGNNEYDIEFVNSDGTIQFVHYRNIDDHEKTHRAKIEVDTMYPEQKLDVMVINTSDLDELAIAVGAWAVNATEGGKLPYRDSYGFLRLVRKPSKAYHAGYIPGSIPRLYINASVTIKNTKSDTEFISGFQMLACSMIDQLNVSHGIFNCSMEVDTKVVTTVSMKVLTELEDLFNEMNLGKDQFTKFLNMFLASFDIARKFDPISDDDDVPF